jgi:hypothetical protein
LDIGRFWGSSSSIGRIFTFNESQNWNFSYNCGRRV